MTTYVHEKIRFVALGSKTVGKSAFGIRLLENGDFFRKDEKWYKIEHHFCEFIAKLGQKILQISILGVFRYDKRDNYVDRDMAVILFSIGDPDSFKDVEKKVCSNSCNSPCVKVNNHNIPVDEGFPQTWEEHAFHPCWHQTRSATG